MAQFDPVERAYYDRLFAAIDEDDSGVLPGQDALPFLVSSGLPQQILGEVWAIADPANNGFLTRDGWYKAARLIGWLQNGDHTVDDTLAGRPGPYPKFPGHTPPTLPGSPVATTKASSSFPPISPSDRTKFTRIFVASSPSNGLVTGDKARDVFVKSQLGYEKLGQIWNLADTQQRGSLDLADFIVGMHLIQSCMANPSLTLPATLPPGIYEQASGGRAPLTPQRTGSSIRPQNTGPASPIAQRVASPIPSSQWDVTPEAKATSDQFFSQLDPQNKGSIEGDVAVPFMLQSQLDESTLATIWDLADIKHEGRLDRDQFAVAMYLINGKLAGKDVPATLPQSLIPPRLRGVQPVGSSITRDLFDLFDDPPSTTVQIAARSAFAPAASTDVVEKRSFASPPPVRPASLARSPPSDLLGDDTQAMTQNSIEIGNKRNEVENTSARAEELADTRQKLEQQEASRREELQDLEAKLSEAKRRHETETQAVADLQSRVSEQSERLQSLQAEVISAESEVSALKSEKTELEQALLKHKEEVRELQRRMKNVDEEKVTLKTVLDKLRKDSRQQKGLVSIAKKQLSTAETARDDVQRDIDNAAASPEENATPAASIPLPATPQVLSPVPTGVSTRSNNPFDRLSRASSHPTGAAVVGAGAAATAGLIVAGAETLFKAAKDSISPQTTTEPLQSDLDQPSNEKDPFGPEPTSPSSTVPPVDTTSGSDHVQAYTAVDEKIETLSTGDIEPGGVDVSEDPVTEETHLDSAKDVSTFENTEQDIDPFGVPSAPKALASTEFSNSFGDPASDRRDADFDTAFDDFDEAPAQPPVAMPAVETPPIQSFPAEVGTSVPADHDSSDEDDGPEDLDAPARYTSSPLAEPIARRSAPPPPPRQSDLTDLDPFGAHPTLPVATNFDEEDFDFSDLPPVKTAEPAPQDVSETTANFDDEFAAFDDEFGTSRQTGSDNSNLSKSFEMVSPAPHVDEWGASSQQPASQGSLTFDDAFGETPAAQAQNDDIEDVQKLCAMGFSRSLVIAALDANGYDFQKALNVLLAQ